MQSARVTLLTAALLAACDGQATDAQPSPDPHGPKTAAAAPAQVSPQPEQSQPETSQADAVAEAPSEPAQPQQPQEPQKPDDYGAVHPPVAPLAQEEFTLHGQAGFEVVAVYSQPNLKSPRMGYMRFGQRTMVGPKIDDTGEGCRKGFHALPTGGYSCASKGLTVSADKAPYMYLPPPAPKVDTPMPYDYAVIAKSGTPMWWRMADADEVMLAQQRYELEHPSDDPKEGGKVAVVAKPGTPGAKPRALPSVLDTKEGPGAIELTPEEKAEFERKRKQAQAKAAAVEKADQERKEALADKAKKLPLHPSRPFLERGFMISLGSKVRDKGRSWWRTARGGFVPSAKTYRYKGKDFQGVELPEGTEFPFGFVYDEKAVFYSLDVDSGKLKRAKKAEHRSFVDLDDERSEVGGRVYIRTSEGLYLREKSLRLAQPQEMPEQAMPWERWIDVSLDRQLLVAYEGTVPVYATLVSTGKRGSKEESFATPKGTWRIRTKHISSSMAGSTATDGDYSIQDVPWAMFFEGNYALHGAFWHTRFGRTRSHGCVNLGPTDARWLFYWTTPFLPESWHGVSAHEGSPGSLVVVH